MGQATVARLTAKGHRVIGVDLRGADMNVDLGNAEGRADMVEQVRAMRRMALTGC